MCIYKHCRVALGSNYTPWFVLSRANKERWSFLPPPPHNVTAFKGAVHIVANRDYVEFALHNQKAIDLLTWVRKTSIPDECFFATLNHNPILRIKGTYLGKHNLHIATLAQKVNYFILQTFQEKQKSFYLLSLFHHVIVISCSKMHFLLDFM